MINLIDYIIQLDIVLNSKSLENFTLKRFSGVKSLNYFTFFKRIFYLNYSIRLFQVLISYLIF